MNMIRTNTIFRRVQQRSSLLRPHLTTTIGCSMTNITLQPLNSASSRNYSTSKTVWNKEEHPDITTLLENNRKWVNSTNKKDDTYFPTLGSGQSPKYLYIGCADSRVAVGNLMGIEMGDIFIHRNIANMVVASDISFLSVLSYAVDYLKVQHILVTGHYDCGGVRAAAQQKDSKGQILDAWLQNIRDVYRIHRVELDSITDEHEKHRRMVELNVQEQCVNVHKTSIVQRRRMESIHENKSGVVDETKMVPQIHGMVFDPSTGVLNKLPIDFTSIYNNELKGTYDLY
jgi:carbonic anhydrase